MDPNVFETANAGFAQVMYEEFLRDPASVDAEWRQLFESGVVGEAPPLNGTGAASRAPDAAEPAPAPVAPAATPAAPAAASAPTVGAAPIKGPAARLVQNMNESLTVPTATTFRELPVAQLESARKALNAALKQAGRSEKISFTHLIAWAIVRGTRQHPVMGNTFAEQDGKPVRITPPGINLGLAVDVTRKDGSRGLVVPVIKGAESMDFAAFLRAYEGLVEKARVNKLLPDDFAGATMSLTNPGRPRHARLGAAADGRPGEHHRSRLDRLPARVRDGCRGARRRTRHLEGDDHQQHVRPPDHPGCRVGRVPGRGGRPAAGGRRVLHRRCRRRSASRWPRFGRKPTSVAPAVAQPGSTAPVATSALFNVAAGMALVKAFRTHGHLAAHLDPLGSEPIGDPALNPVPLGLTPDVMAQIPAAVLRVAVPGETLLDAYPHLQETYCGTLAYQVEHIASHEERVWLREQIESGAVHSRTPGRAAQAAAGAADPGGGARAVPAQGISRAEALLDRGRGHAGADARRHHRDRGR